MIDSLLQSLQDTSIATAIREGDSLFPWIECVHVLALTLVIGSIAIVDLRLLGVRFRDRAVLATTAEVLPITWTAFVFALLSGALMFASNAVTYAHNGFFLTKMSLLALAGLNMLGYHMVIGRNASSWRNAATTPFKARVVGGASLALWIAIAACGRWIGFTINAPA
jgi:hypothetical protein